jgi:hypothetical protein
MCTGQCAAVDVNLNEGGGGVTVLVVLPQAHREL